MNDGWDHSPYYEVSFGINRSRRYHAKMQDFYQRWYDYTNVGNALCGAGAFLALFGGKDSFAAQILIGAVTLFSTVATVLGPAKKARTHSDLVRKFTLLAAELVKREPTPTNLKWAISQRLKIEEGEPPVRRLIDILAENEEHRARGVPESELVPLSSWQRFFGYWRDFGMKRLEDWKDAQERRHLAAGDQNGATP